MEEQAEIENAWNAIRNSEQVQKVLAHLGLFPVCLKQAKHTMRLIGRSHLTNPGFYHEVAARAWSRILDGIRTDEKG
jgi:tRNA A58 N-methylase Trm61